MSAGLRGLRRAIGCGIAIAGMLVSWCLAGSYAGGMAQQNGTATLHCENAPLTLADVKHMQEVESDETIPTAFAAWRQWDHQNVENPLLERSITLSLMRVSGDTTLALPVPVPVRLAEQDRRGCLLDAETAQALFGDRNAIGNELELAERTYVVRGVFDAPAATMVVRSGPDDSLPFDLVTLDVVHASDPERAAEEFAFRHGLESSLTSQSGTAIPFADLCSRLALWAMGIVMIIRLLRVCMARRNYPVQWGLLLLLLLGAAALWLWAADWRASIPQALIPTRWSDFSFWSRTASQLWDQFLQLAWMKRNRPDVYLLSLWGRACFWGLAGLLFFCVGVRRIRIQSWLGFWSILSFGLLCALGGLLLAASTGFSIGRVRPIWLALPIYWGVTSFAAWLECHPQSVPACEIEPASSYE